MSSTFLTDVAHVAVLASGIDPDTYTTTQTGTGVDMQLSDGPVTAILQVKSHDRDDGDETLDVKLQESDVSGSGYADITGATIAQVNTTGAKQLAVTTNLRQKRYMRVVATIAGTTPSTKFGVLLLARKKIV